jgi:general secretion pathway protein E
MSVAEDKRFVAEAAPPPAAPAAGWDAFTAWAVEEGLIDPVGLERARRVATETNQRLAPVLTQLGLISERGLAEGLARYAGLPLAMSARYPAEPVWPDRLRPRFLRRAHVVPVAVEDGRLAVAAVDPLDTFTAQAISLATGCAVSMEVAVPIELEAALDRLYPETERQGAGDGPLPEADIAGDDTERLKDLASEAPVIRLVNQLISRAVETRASDIHIEPFEDRLRVRYRYDGVLHEVDSPPARRGAAIISRIKIMARLDIAERRLPQDGRIKLAVRGQEIDFRVSTIPSLHGETVVLRVLDRSAVEFDYGKLGLPAEVTATLKRLLELPNGMVLVTGPTGSGKTTTLYTGLRHLNSVARNIVTVEDPIEYQLGGITQIQVKPQIGLTFATLLRSILRQDPDVIMIGEIRDLETAQIAVQASLTGHLMLSTLHTNTAAAAITRLRDMGLEDYLIVAVLRGVLAQRLVRRLCDRCKDFSPMPPELVQRFGLEGRAQTPRLYRAVGCPECRNTGYRGREAIAELLLPSEEVQRLIFARVDHTQIERAAVASGMKTMFDAGLDAALAGRTTIDEVLRSIQSEG